MDSASLPRLVQNVFMNWTTIFKPAIQPFFDKRRINTSDIHSSTTGGMTLQYFIKKMLFTKVNQARMKRKKECDEGIVNRVHVARNPTQAEAVVVAHRNAAEKRKSNTVRASNYHFMAIDVGDGILLRHPFEKRKSLEEWVDRYLKGIPGASSDSVVSKLFAHLFITNKQDIPHFFRIASKSTIQALLGFNNCFVRLSEKKGDMAKAWCHKHGIDVPNEFREWEMSSKSKEKGRPHDMNTLINVSRCNGGEISLEEMEAVMQEVDSMEMSSSSAAPSCNSYPPPSTSSGPSSTSSALSSTSSALSSTSSSPYSTSSHLSPSSSPPPSSSSVSFFSSSPPSTSSSVLKQKRQCTTKVREGGTQSPPSKRTRSRKK